MTELHDIDFTLEYPYTRTTGPVMGPFLTGVRDGRILGSRVGDRVLCPPVEYDPSDGSTVGPDQLVEVGPGGEVTSWTWVATPTSKHPFDHPFAFAQILLDGADTTMLQAVDAGSIDAMATGMRVTARFRDERHGAVTDLFFVPGDEPPDPVEPGEEPVAITEHLIGVRIHEPLFPLRRRFAEALLDGRILGQRSPADGKVHVPSRGYDASNRVPMTEADDVEVEPVGTVTSFTEITPIQYHGQTETEPYIRCSVLLDGADTTVGGIDIRDIPVDEFRVGMRLRMVWRPEGERDVSEVENRWGGLPAGVYERWEPTGEPDVDPDLVKEHNF